MYLAIMKCHQQILLKITGSIFPPALLTNSLVSVRILVSAFFFFFSFCTVINEDADMPGKMSY